MEVGWAYPSRAGRAQGDDGGRRREEKKAAAATSAELNLESVHRFFRMTFDRQFLAVVRDEVTSDVLFIAFIADPK